MPITIPVKDRPQVAPRPLPGASIDARVSPEDITGGVEKSLVLAAGIASQKAKERRATALDARLDEANAALGEERLKIQSDLAQRKGKSALEAPLDAEAEARLTQAAEAIAAGLPEDVAAKFRGRFLEEKKGLKGFALGHTLAQADAVAADARSAAVAVALKKAEVASTPAELEAAKREGLDVLDRAGVPAEAAKVDFLDKFDKLDLGTMARRKAAELEQLYGGDLKSALEDAQQIDNVRLSDAVVARLKQRAGDLEIAQNAFDKDALGRITSRVERSRGAWDAGTDPDYGKLSDYAKGQADAHRAQVERSLRAARSDALRAGAEARRAAADARREQRDWNTYAAEVFEGLPLEVQAKVDLTNGTLPDGSRIPPEAAVALAGLDRMGFAVLKAKQARVARAIEKGRAIEYTEFTKRVEQTTRTFDSEERKAAVRAEMDAMFFAAVDKSETGAPPGAKEVAEALANAVLRYDTTGPSNDTAAEIRARGEDPSKYSLLPVEEQPVAARERAKQLLEGKGRPGGQVKYGELIPPDASRPIVLTGPGSYATEMLIGVGTPDGEEVIRRVVDGKLLSEEQAKKLWKEGKNPPVARFKTVEEANAYAKQRHENEAATRGADADLARQSTHLRGKPATSVADIDPGERKLIEDAYRTKNKLRPTDPIDPAEILRWYNLAHPGGR